MLCSKKITKERKKRDEAGNVTKKKTTRKRNVKTKPSSMVAQNLSSQTYRKIR